MLDFWLVATMAMVATLGSRPLKKISLGFSLVGYHPTSFPSFKKNQFQFLGVAMVAIVAMLREYTENGSRQMKLPDAWRHPNAERELARMRDFWLVATRWSPWPPS